MDPSVISALRVMSVHFEIMPALETDIVLQLPEDSQFRLDQHRPPWQKAVRCLMQGEVWLFLGALPSFELFKNMSFCKIRETFLVSEPVNFKYILSSLANVNMSHYLIFSLFSCFLNFPLIHFQKGIMQPYEIRQTVDWVCFIISHLMTGINCWTVDDWELCNIDEWSDVSTLVFLQSYVAVIN